MDPRSGADAPEEDPCDDLLLDDEQDDLLFALETVVHAESDDAREAEIRACPQNLAGPARTFSDAWTASKA